MRLALFAVGSVSSMTLCTIGLNGDLTQVEALVPVYLLGLIASVVTVGCCCCVLLIRAARWLVTTGR